MKRTALIALICLFYSCKKENTESKKFLSDSLHINVTPVNSNTSYNINSYEVAGSSFSININNSFGVKTYAVAVYSGETCGVNYIFNNGQYESNGTITFTLGNQTLKSVSGYGGSNDITIP